MVFDGSLASTKMTKEIKDIHKRWTAQRDRCQNPKNAAYYRYGARGVRVVYGSREFIGWFIEERQKFPVEQWGKLDVGRIDHDGNYAFGNVEIQTKSQNSKEMIRRNGAWKMREIFCYNIIEMTGIKVESLAQAVKITGCSQPAISRQLCGSIKTTPLLSWRFSYAANKWQV